MNPKSGKAGTAVAPTDPKDAVEADKAKPGEVLKPPAPTTKAHNPTTAKQQKKKLSWIEIEMVDEEDQPVPGMPYQITLPDGATVAEGTLDEKGSARVEGIEPGNCQISFPTLDQDAWQKI